MRFLIRFLSPSLVYTLVQLFQGQTYIKKRCLSKYWRPVMMNALTFREGYLVFNKFHPPTRQEINP